MCCSYKSQLRCIQPMVIVQLLNRKFWTHGTLVFGSGSSKICQSIALYTSVHTVFSIYIREMSASLPALYYVKDGDLKFILLVHVSLEVVASLVLN